MKHAIHHLVGIKAPAATVYEAIATPKGLSGWWSTDVRGSGKKGETLEVHFDTEKTSFKVADSKKNRLVKWKSIKGYEFSGTEVTIELKRSKGETLVFFKHSGWKKPDQFYSFASTKWATFLLSLKDMVEKGEGRPFPRDTYVMNQDV